MSVFKLLLTGSLFILVKNREKKAFLSDFYLSSFVSRMKQRWLNLEYTERTSVGGDMQ